MRNNKQLRRLGAALVVLVLIFGFMSATARDRSEVTVVEKAISTLLYPLQVATDWVAERFRGVGQSVQELTHLREENAQLRSQVQQASQLAARNQLLEQENQTLRSELQLKAESKYPLVAATVISRSPDAWYRTVTINRGSREGVKPNMAVVNWQGLVGKVLQTTPFTSTVQLATDAGFGQTGFGVGAKLPTGELGIIETVQGGYLRMHFFSNFPSVQLGQPIFTSGAGLLPGDLLIGYAESFNTSGSSFDKYVNIRPSVDFHKLDVVQVVLTTTDGGAKGQ
ncbi:MAG: rod shape-determining protein MreC [Mycobacterium leprae]